jgi:hypothetical protein
LVPLLAAHIELRSAPRPNYTPKALADHREHEPETLWVCSSTSIPKLGGKR